MLKAKTDGKIVCPRCGSYETKKRGHNQCQCNECGKYYKYTEEDEIRALVPKNVAAKILLFDIETAPMEVYVWGLRYNDYISPESIIKDYSVLCWSAKWLFEPEVFGEKVTGQEAIDREDARILEPMWKALDEADIVVVQNGKKFDIPKLNSRFLLAGFMPPMYYQVIDTKEAMSKNFGFSSNKLDYVNKLLGIKGKEDMEYQDWIDCVHGDEEKLQKMLTYNKDDVVIMEDLYLQIRPWIKGYANLGWKKARQYWRASGVKKSQDRGLLVPIASVQQREAPANISEKIACERGSVPSNLPAEPSVKYMYALLVSFGLVVTQNGTKWDTFRHSTQKFACEQAPVLGNLPAGPASRSSGRPGSLQWP
jgi:uncharacterized protein YprB with RNaseH-like and TPR domain